MINDLKIRTFKNVGYNTISQLVAFVFQFLSSIILARYLSSSDYGLVGFAWIFINFLVLFNDIGINSAVIQKRDLDDKALYTAFTMKVVLGVSLFVISFIIAPIAPYLFDNPDVIPVLRVLSLNFIISIFYFLPETILKRELNYKKISFVNICSIMLGSTVSIVLVLNGYKYWSIVYGSLVAAVTLAFVFNFVRPVKIGIRFDLGQVKGFLHYGGPLFISGLIVFTIFNADNFIIGTVGGASTLGFYAIAFTWGSMVCTKLSKVVLTVLFPTFAAIQHDKEKMKRAYLKVLEYVAFLAILANVTLFIISEEFLVNVLGHGSDKWLPALATLRVLCIYGIVRAILEPVGSVIMATGRTDLLFKANLLAAIVELIFLYPALKYFGIQGVAVIVTLAYVVQCFIYIPYLKRQLNIEKHTLFKAVQPSVLSSAAIVPVYLLYEYLHFDNTIYLLIQKTIITVFCYMLLYGFITKWKIFKEVKGILGPQR